MRTISLLPYCLVIAILVPALTFAETKPIAEAKAPKTPAKEIIIAEDNVYIPDSVYLKDNDKKFNFNWNSEASIMNNKDKVADIEVFVAKIKDYASLSKEEKQAYTSLLYKLGTYYTHVLREPDLAINKLALADLMLTNKQAKAWTYNHLAYAYEQKYGVSKNPKDKEKALFYVSKVLTNLYPHQKNKEVAFALSIQGLIQKNAQDDEEAKDSFNQALEIYGAIAQKDDEQYVRIQNQLANLLLYEAGKEQEALEQLQQIQQYWLSKADVAEDPYAARSFLSLAQAYLRVGNALAARDEINRAIAIYQKVYGDKSKRLKLPYQLLGAAYEKLGDSKQGLAYEQKALALMKQQSQTNIN